MDNAVLSAKMLAQLVDLGVAIMTGCDAVVGLGGLDLVVLGLSVGESLLLETGLEETAAAAAAEVVGFVGGHVDEVLFSDNGLDNKPQVFGNGVAIGLTHDLTGILNGKLDLEILVPVGVYLEFTFPDPLCVVFVDVLDFKVVLDVVFFQSCQD